MKFTMDIPFGVITPGEFQTAAAIAEMARAMEAAGIDACYTTDHPAPDAAWLRQGLGHDAVDPFTAFGFVAAATTQLRMHTNILVMAYRNPFITAKAAATLHTLSGGRLILGCGAGYQKIEFDALGVDFHKRGKLFDEALDVLQLAWAGGAVVYQGANFNAANNLPRPALASPPPIWIGGGSGKAVERAALKGDGWSPFFAAPTMSASNIETGIHSVEQLGENIQRAHAIRAAAGRTGAFDVAIGAQAKLVIGDADSAATYVDAVRELEKVGVTWTMIELPHPSRAGFVDNVQWFGDEVIARLRG
jgi:probable F420-dependent oxidoreductase